MDSLAEEIIELFPYPEGWAREFDLYPDDPACCEGHAYEWGLPWPPAQATA